MTKQESDILKILSRENYVNQRMLSQRSGHSLGVVNKVLKSLTKAGFLTADFHLTRKADRLIRESSPENAVILAAGYGMRMVPINLETPKGLLKVNGEPLIERTIRQLQEAGITDITVVVGFMKESYEYLMDTFGVKLKVNPEYASRNNLHSLALVAHRISNTYIVPCDIWCDQNPFDGEELYSWYMVSDLVDDDSEVRVNRKSELVRTEGRQSGNAMVGIAYVTGRDAKDLVTNLTEMDQDRKYTDAFWEEAAFRGDRMFLEARIVSSENVVEVNTYEQLRDLDAGSEHLKSDAMQVISENLHVSPSEITHISVLKKGMTNRSFLFQAAGKKYIMRIPGEGTEQLINRKHEADAYDAISGKGICQDNVYLNPENGYKITRFLEGCRVCDPHSEPDVYATMKKLAGFHRMNLKCGHAFDLYGGITFYEKLRGGNPSCYQDYEETKKHVLALQKFTDRVREKWSLTHIDANCDNFLFYRDEKGDEKIDLIDWEYAGMQDPDLDIAMNIIYALYNREEADRLIDLYMEAAGETCTEIRRTKIYAYMAAGGLLWSNWCEYKRSLGVEFGEYSLAQYRYAKDYYRLAEERGVLTETPEQK